MKQLCIMLCVLSGIAGAQQAPTSLPPAGVPADAKPFNGHWYKVFFEQLDWHQAKQECERKKGQLAVIPDATTWHFIKELTRKIVWLGASKDNLKNEWRWVDGTPVGFTAWLDGQPNNTGGKQHFLATTESESWQDRAAEWSASKRWPIRGYICQWKDPTQIAAYTMQLMPPGIPADAKLFNGHGWKVFFEHADWDQAKQRCEQMGGQLAVIPDSATWNFVKALTRKTVWLGATDESAEGHWQWIDGTPMSFTAWDDGEPGNTDKKEHFLCRGTYNGWADTAKKWDAYRSWSVEGFICQWKRPPPNMPQGNPPAFEVTNWDVISGALEIRNQSQTRSVRVSTSTTIRVNGQLSNPDKIVRGSRVTSYQLVPGSTTNLGSLDLETSSQSKSR